MDIGTAKPTAQELATVPHHLINIRDPLHAYSAADFAREATVLMQDITARGRMPLLVGGTMLYFKALRDGLDDMPPANPDIRRVLEHEAKQKGWPALHAELARVDPRTAARLAPQDSQRIARALEVYRLTGLPLSHFHTTKNVARSALSERATGLNGLKHSETDALLISLEPPDRAWLHQRIAQRFDAMLAAGFLDEVKALRARGDLHPDLPALRCVGYRQAWEYLDAMEAPLTSMGASPPRIVTPCGSGTLAANSGHRIRGEGAAPTETPVLFHVKSPTGPSPLADFRDKGIIATRQLAKRQMTWLRSMADRRVVACDAPDALQQVLALADQFFSTAA
jgi:tRNA dimethylallyltransferase